LVGGILPRKSDIKLEPLENPDNYTQKDLELLLEQMQNKVENKIADLDKLLQVMPNLQKIVPQLQAIFEMIQEHAKNFTTEFSQIAR
jgi:endonuclease III-like uncharacterized protein